MSQDEITGGKLHRLVKLLMDTGEASTVNEAEEKLKGYRLGIHVDREVLDSPAYQAGLLTIINTGRRCFLGGVLILGDLDIPLKIPWRRFQTVAEAVEDLQGKVVDKLDASIPLISFSENLPGGWGGDFGIKPAIRGWSGGILPIQDQFDFSGKEMFTPAGVLAGALAVSEAFQFVRGGNSTLGHRSVGISLWKPSRDVDWLNADPGPNLSYLPQKLWLIGLGNLGQAYLWTLGFLPYSTDNKMKDNIKFVLQDIDRLEEANDSTSLLTDLSMVGMKKTRAMSDWCEQYGFQTSLIERKFADDLNANDEEPLLALCGVDNAEARATLEKSGFKRVIEAGLGKGVEEYLCFRMHTFPASKSAVSYWGSKLDKDDAGKLIQQPAYQDLHGRGLDQCGLTELAGRSVGAPFVGAIASTLVIAEVLRMLNGGDAIEVIDGDLRSLPTLNKVIPIQIKLKAFNSGMFEV
jgi:hypothetical protein